MIVILGTSFEPPYLPVWRKMSLDLVIACLLYTSHGGANIKVMEMMRDIRSHVKHWDDEDEVRAYLRKMMDGEVFDHKGLRCV